MKKRKPRIILFGIVIKIASNLKKTLIEEVSHYDNDTYQQLIGVYQSRIFGLCIYRVSSSFGRLEDELQSHVKTTQQ